jgi:hypothetical protein
MAKPLPCSGRCLDLPSFAHLPVVGRSAQAREANERIAGRAEQLQFVSRVPLLCECSDPACDALVLIGLEEYRQATGGQRRHVLTAPGHAVVGALAHVKHADYWLQLSPAGRRP